MNYRKVLVFVVFLFLFSSIFAISPDSQIVAKKIIANSPKLVASGNIIQQSYGNNNQGTETNSGNINQKGKNVKNVKIYYKIVISKDKKSYKIYSLNKKTPISSLENAKILAKAGLSSYDDVKANYLVGNEKLSDLIVNKGYGSSITDFSPISTNINKISSEIEKTKTDITKCDASKSCNPNKINELNTKLKNENKELMNNVEVIDKLDGWNKVLSKVSKDEMSTFLKQYNDNKCGDTFIVGYLCKHFSKTTKEDLLRHNFLSILSKVNQNSKLDFNAKNKERAKKFFKNLVVSNDEKKKLSPCETNLISKECKNAIEDYKKNCKSNDDVCNQNLEYYNLASEQTEIKSSPTYLIVNGILNPSYTAIQAARLFGFSTNYNRVPDFLKKSFPSQICEAKISGYLDKTVSNNGGQTKYGSCNEVLDPRDPNIDRGQCIQVIGDVRAQRTEITPDEKTDITYSAFIRAPDDNDVKYIVAFSYKLKNGNLKKEILTKNISTLSKGDTKDLYQNVNFPLNYTKSEVLPNSFKVYLLVINPDRSIYLFLRSPIELISFNSRIASVYQEKAYNSGNTEGNSDAKNNDNSELTENNLLDLIG